jgi:hypothetical protein
MNIMVRIPRVLLVRAKADLARRHPFAFERAGFFSTRCVRTKSTTLVCCVAYHSIPDEHYIEDESVGARIGPKAITSAMSRAVADPAGQIHVHWHGGSGLPSPSGTDKRELPPLSGSFRNANNAEAHGWMILGENDAYTSLLMPGEAEAASAASVSIIGFPTTANRRASVSPLGKVVSGLFAAIKRRTRKNKRYARQSLLGANADSIIGQSVIGVVGLGGGGSHVVQQLAHLGLRNFVLCDDDIITESNLNRLVGGTSADVRAKRLKAAIAARTILKLQKNANIVAPGEKWESITESLLNCDIIFGCVDTFLGRRDLEAFCRRNLIPLIDVGMDVRKLAGAGFEIDGQIILSMPGYPCMHCTGFLNETVLAQEAARYGAAGDRPQVVWSNGVLCSAAVGIAVDLLTDWSGKLREPMHQSFRGSDLSLGPDNRLASLRGMKCCHYPFNNVGAPVLKTL